MSIAYNAVIKLFATIANNDRGDDSGSIQLGSITNASSPASTQRFQVTGGSTYAGGQITSAPANYIAIILVPDSSNSGTLSIAADNNDTGITVSATQPVVLFPAAGLFLKSAKTQIYTIHFI